MDVSDLWKIIVLFVCLVLSAFFSASETAYISLRRLRLMHLVKTGKPGARRVSRLMERPDKLLATVLLGNNMVNTGMAALATAVAISLFENETLAVLIATVAVTLVLLVFGETLPKTLAWSRAEGMALIAARPLIFVGWLLAPPIRVLQLISLVARKALGITALHSQLTEEEIRTMIAVGVQAGAVERTEAEMLEKVFHFGDRQVHEIMTPRTAIVWVEKNATLEEFLKLYCQDTHTRFPVFEDNIENVIGILSVKDLLLTMAQEGIQPGDSVAELLRPAYFVPETKLAGELFSELREAGQQMAIVIDQYGGVAGLVTLERLLEVIVGLVREEGEPAQEDFSTIGENIYDVDAGIGIQKANEEMGLDLPEGSYHTLAGFILERLGHIPQEGEHLNYGNLGLVVTEMKRIKIERVQIRVLSATDEGVVGIDSNAANGYDADGVKPNS